MPFKLRLQRELDDATEFLFEHREDAVEHAVAWLWSGHDTLKDEYLAERLPTEARQLRSDLENGREYRSDFLQVRASVGASRPDSSTSWANQAAPVFKLAQSFNVVCADS